MSEFQEKFQAMKEGMTEVMNEPQHNPALISSDLVDDEGNVQLPNDNLDEQHEQPLRPPRNERGHRTRKNVKDRLEIIIAENRAQAAQQQQLMSYIEEQQRTIADLQAKANQSDHNSNIYFKQGLDNDEQRVSSELKFADETGDIEKKIELQKRLAEIAAQRQTLLLSESLSRQQPQPQNYPPVDNYPTQQPIYYPNQPVPYNQRQEFANDNPVNEHFEDWVENNSWYDKHSANYDPQLANEVDQVAEELNKYLKFNQQGDMIGTPQYYDAVSNIMQDRYGTQNNNNNNTDYDNNNYYQDNSIYEVAPVTKKGTTMADRYMANKQGNVRAPSQSGVALTPDQEAVARGLVPVLTKLYGRQFSLEEAKAEYYKELKKDQQDQLQIRQQVRY